MKRLQSVGILVMLLLVPLLGGGVPFVAVAIVDSTGTAAAQDQPADECPANLICAEYEGDVYEIDPVACGPVAAFIIRQERTIITTSAGDDVNDLLTGVVFVRDANSYEAADTFMLPATETLDNLTYGALGCLNWGDTVDATG